MSESSTPIQDKGLEHQKFQLEKEKLAFERSKEQGRLELEADKLKQAKRDTSKRVLSSFIVTVLVTGGLTLFGMHFENKRSEEAEQNRIQLVNEAEKSRKAEMTIQLINAREKANNDLRASMFNTLIDFYRNDPNQMSTVLLLELIGLNFKDTVLLKPVFEKLYWDDETTDDQKRALRSASRKIVNDQLEAIRQARDGHTCNLTLSIGETGSAWCFPPLSLKLVSADSDNISVQTNSDEGMLREDKSTKNGSEFDVNFFDMPMIDYTVSSTGEDEIWRYAVVLQKSDSSGATISVAILPQDSYSAQMPFRFDEMMSDYINPRDRYD